MARALKAGEKRRSVPSALANLAREIRQQYGPEIGWNKLLGVIQDRRCAYFPCEICFDAAPLLPGESAYPTAKGQHPEDGYILNLHPRYANQLHQAIYLVLHQLALVNFGEAITLDDAETFGALVLGVSKDDYYQTLCELSGQIGGDELD
jgi:hypothetical protein